MQIGILKTDGGPHSAESWAAATVAQIISIASSAPKALVAEAQALEAKLVALLTQYHGSVQQDERDALKAEGADRLATEIDTDPHHSDAYEDVLKLVKGTSFQSHFAKPEVQSYLSHVLHEHFHHNMLIERSWHADEHPDHQHSKAFKARLVDGRLGAYAGNPPKGDK